MVGSIKGCPEIDKETQRVRLGNSTVVCCQWISLEGPIMMKAACFQTHVAEIHAEREAIACVVASQWHCSL